LLELAGELVDALAALAQQEFQLGGVVFLVC
jgi:hypothetical protein